MNTTTSLTARSLRLAALAVPMAAALTLGAGAAAHADDTFDPALIQVMTLDPGALDTDPVGPVGPGDLTTDPGDCEQTGTCVDPGDPGDPGDEDPTVPEGPGDLTTGDDCEQTDTCGGGGDGGEEPQPEPQPEPEPVDPTEPTTTDTGDGGAEVEVPTRIDAGAAAQAESGTELSWLLPGGLLVTAAGVAFAARRTRSGSEA